MSFLRNIEDQDEYAYKDLSSPPSITTRKIYVESGVLKFDNNPLSIGSSISDGTVSGTTLYWNGSNWVENIYVNFDDSGLSFFVDTADFSVTNAVAGVNANFAVSSVFQTNSLSLDDGVGQQTLLMDLSAGNYRLNFGTAEATGFGTSFLNQSSSSAASVIISTLSPTQSAVYRQKPASHEIKSNTTFVVGGGLQAEICVGDNSSGSVSTHSTSDYNAVFINSKNTTANSALVNVTAICGNGKTLTKSNTTTIGAGQVVNVTSPVSYPYTLLSSDYIINVDTSAARTINLIATPETGRIYYIKDITGSAASNNITLSPASGNIDGSGSYAIATNRMAVGIYYNGTEWSVI